MANVVYSNSISDIWPPQALSGGNITIRTATNMTYVSDAGYTITLRGSGFGYDDDGFGNGGTIAQLIVAKDGVTYAEYSGLTTDLTRASTFLYEYPRDNGNTHFPNPYDFMQVLLVGNDLVTGSDGRDDLSGGFGNDTVRAGAGFDYVSGDFGADVLDGGADRDALSYDTENQSILAFRGIKLDAAAGTAIDPWGFTDTFQNFEAYKDTFFADTLKGSDMDEEFSLSRGIDVVDGRAGFDWVYYDETSSYGGLRGVRVNLSTGIAVDSWKNSDSLTNIEAVRGSSFNDTLIGSARDERFEGGDGVDSINGAGGQDWLIFWNVGNNGRGNGVIVNLSATTSVADDGYGNAENASGIEVVMGSRFADRLTGNGLANFFSANEGNDTLNGGLGNDDLNGEDGDDVVIGGSGNDQVNGGASNDTLTGNTGADLFNFFESSDRMGVDHITDFDVGVDQIRIAGWYGGFSGSDLTDLQFRAAAGATTATTAAHRVIYNTKTGDLYLDRDGVGGSSAVHFAHLDNAAVLTFADFGIAS